MVAVVSVVALAAVGCVSAPPKTAAGARVSPIPVALPEVAPSPVEPVASGLQDPSAPGLPRPLVNPADILAGGPPPDGIPAIDHPKFERADEVSWIRGNEPVIALTVGTDSRAYPVQVLIWHEIVNDTVSGVPLAVSYCPLCNTAIAYGRHVGTRVLSFGTSGKLFNSDLVMYDRQTESLWVQFLGEAVAGVLTGTKLVGYPLQTVSWSEWHLAHPRGWVLSRDTGFDRPYGTDPYPGYDNPNSTPFLFHGRVDRRYAPMTRVVGIRVGSDALAIPLELLRTHPVLNCDVGGEAVVVFWSPGTSSPLDASDIAAGVDIGATGVFSSVVGTRVLRFGATLHGFADSETGSAWDIEGRAVSGSLTGESLKQVAHVDTFWFVWAVFQPNTRLLPAERISCPGP
jgi:hypothetical protein